MAGLKWSPYLIAFNFNTWNARKPSSYLITCKFVYFISTPHTVYLLLQCERQLFNVKDIIYNMKCLRAMKTHKNRLNITSTARIPRKCERSDWDHPSHFARSTTAINWKIKEIWTDSFRNLWYFFADFLTRIVCTNWWDRWLIRSFFICGNFSIIQNR